jgi:hypothetical protein
MSDHVFRNQVNASGFPFQLRVLHEVQATSGIRHKWTPLPQEHYWANPQSDAEGFIDLILERQRITGDDWYMVIECKRQRGGNWVFLTPGEQRKRWNAHMLRAHRQYGMPRTLLSLTWVESEFDPSSLVSPFCTVPGQSDRQTPKLEGISKALLDSIESLAEKQLDIGPELSGAGSEHTAFYIPVIVTNTELMVCQFEPQDVDMLAGELDASSGKFQSVPYIRFRKSMATRFPTGKVPMSLREDNRENERTVFVVHAPSLPEFLAAWDLA